MAGLFTPPPLFFAFHLNGTWTGVGTKPGDYQFECSRSGMPSLILGRFFLPFAFVVDVFLMISVLHFGGS